MADYGLQVWDAAGNLTLGITDRLHRILGTVVTGTSNGSYVDAALAEGEPYFHIATFDFVQANTPRITISGTTISWTFPQNFGSFFPNFSVQISYGIST